MQTQFGHHPSWEAVTMSNFPQLTAGELHLWWLPLSLDDGQYEKASKLLSHSQLEKYNRRSSAADKKSYLAGRFYLLHLLAAYANCNADEVRLNYSRLGKPSLQDSEQNLNFNFTDTPGKDGNHGLFVFSLDGQVGVDMENLSRDINLSRIVEKRYSTAEQALVSSEGELNHQLALSIWTRKEAYGKAISKGINFKMNAENLVNGDSTSFTFKDSKAKAWRCEQFQIGDEFVACVVHEGHQKSGFKTFNSFTI